MTLSMTTRSSMKLAATCRCPAASSLLGARAQSTVSAPSPSEKLRTPPPTSYALEDCNARRMQLQEETGVDLKPLGGWWDGHSSQTTTALHKAIEKPLGMARLPIAAVGPMQFEGEAASGPIVLPMATTEGALTASVQRGCTAINMSGGIKTSTGAQRMTKSPMFITESPQQAANLAQWVASNRSRIQTEVLDSVSNNTRLAGIVDAVDLNAAHIMFQMETGDETGQQTASLCAAAISNWVLEVAKKELPESFVTIRSCYSEGSMCGHKKASALNVATTRGLHTVAECFLSETALRKVLKTTSATMEVFMHYAERNSAKMGMYSLSTNPVNVVAANFAATGNDVSSAGEAVSGANLNWQRVDGGMKVSMNFPSLVVGTVGGATSLPTQAASLDMMGCRGEGKVRRYAEIVAGYSLALDISTLSAISAHQFADAHDRLGRNRPEESKK